MFPLATVRTSEARKLAFCLECWNVDTLQDNATSWELIQVTH